MKLFAHVFIAIVLTLPFCGATYAQTPPPQHRPPNFIVIFTDDMGYGDLDCYAKDGVKTPNIDRLATEGVRCTDLFSASNVCSPARASLLTGRYPMRCGFPVARNIHFPKYKNYGLPGDELTIPELLKTVDYRTLMVGKWHLGLDVPGSHPCDAGFDHYLGISSNYSAGSALYRDRKVIVPHVPLQELATRYTDEVVKFIGQNKDEPFFIYVSQHIVHLPYKPSKPFIGTSKHGTYGDYIKELDHSTARIMKAIKDAGLDEQTMIVLTSDNGPCGPGSAGPFSGGKFSTMEGGHHVPGIFRWPGHIPAGQVCNVTVSSMDLLPTFCNLANAALPKDRVLDGKDIIDVLMGKTNVTPHEYLYYYSGTNLQAVRHGDWKLHLPRTLADQPFWAQYGKDKGFLELKEPKLFDIASDQGEKQDLSSAQPDIVKQLEAQADIARKELGDVRVQGSDEHKIDLKDPQIREKAKPRPKPN